MGTITSGVPYSDPTDDQITAWLKAHNASSGATSGVANAPGSDEWLIESALSQSFLFQTGETHDATFGTVTAASIKWPDGTSGAYVATSLDSNGEPLGFTATYAGSTTRTVTVVIPRDANSAVSGTMTAVVS